MLGQAIYISNFNEQFKPLKEIEIYFTSFHIAEELNENFNEKAMNLIQLLKKKNKKIIVDISPRGLKQLGFDTLKDFVQTTKIDIVRPDYGFSEEEIIEASKFSTIGINASTLDYKTAETLKQQNRDVLAIHNFYPRPETGLDEEFFTNRNQQLKTMNVLTAAFIAGNVDLRGPIYEGLSTLENHRYLKPYVQFLQLKYKYGLDMILIGDNGISEKERVWINRNEMNDVIYIPVELKSGYEYLYNQVFTVREDTPNSIVRLKESRIYATQGKKIKVEHTIERNKGCITMDNENYLRYSGEIQILKKDYPANEKINVIGQLQKEYIDILKVIDRNYKIAFVR